MPAPAPVSVPASEASALADKPVKSKAELKAERRARQEAERASKHGKKGETGQQASTSKPKATPSELQPGTAVVCNRLRVKIKEEEVHRLHRVDPEVTWIR